MRWEVRTLPNHARLSNSAVIRRKLGRRREGGRERKAAEETVELKPPKGQNPF